MSGLPVARLSSFLRSSPWANLEARTWLLMLAGFALLVRAGYVLVVGRESLSWGDELSYDQLATNMLAHSCFCFVPGEPTMFRAPLYPALMALSYAIFGYGYMPILLVQAIAGALTAPLLALIGRHLSGSLAVGLLAGLMYALHPLLVFTNGLLYTETLYFLLLLGTIYLWLKLVESPSNWLVIAPGSGVLFGFSILMKPNLLLFPIWLALWAWLVFRKRKHAIVSVACVTLMMLVVVLPWSLRNYAISGKLVAVSTNTGLNLAQGNNSQVRGGALEASQLPPTPNLTELERDAFYWKLGVDWIKNHPIEFVALIPWKLYLFFSPLETSNRGSAVTAIAPLIYITFGVFYLLAIIGVVQTAHNWKNWLLIHMLIVYPLLLTLVFYGGTRYGLAVHPFLMLFAAVPVVRLFTLMLERR